MGGVSSSHGGNFLALNYWFHQAYEERRRKRDEEREAKQLAEEELAAKKEAERKEREDAEAEKWLGQISTEQEGTDALDSEEQQVSCQASNLYHPDNENLAKFWVDPIPDIVLTLNLYARD